MIAARSLALFGEPDVRGAVPDASRS